MPFRLKPDESAMPIPVLLFSVGVQTVGQRQVTIYPDATHSLFPLLAVFEWAPLSGSAGSFSLGVLSIKGSSEGAGPLSTHGQSVTFS